MPFLHLLDWLAAEAFSGKLRTNHVMERNSTANFPGTDYET
jgi:hypothetical protein